MTKSAILVGFLAVCSSLLGGRASLETVASELNNVSSDGTALDEPQQPMLYVRVAKCSIDEALKKLEEAAAANKFGVLTVHDLKQKLNAKGVEFGPECRIVEVCNPKKAKSVLEADMSISNALPCRISIYEEDGKVKVSTLRPTAVLGLFGQPKLESIAEEVEEAMIRMIDAACE